MNTNGFIRNQSSNKPPDYLNDLLFAYYPLHFFAVFRAHELFNVKPYIDLLAPPILDLACGDGLISRLLFEKTIDFGLDINLSQIRNAMGSESYSSALLGDARYIPYKDNSVGGVFSNCAFEHIPNMPDLIAEIARILKPGGYLVTTCLTPLYYQMNPLFKALDRVPLRGIRKKAIEAEDNLHNHVSVYESVYYEERFIENGMELEHQHYYATKPIVDFCYAWDSLSKYSFLPSWDLTHRGVLINYLTLRYHRRLVGKHAKISQWYNKFHALCYDRNAANNPGVAQILVAKKL
jgi:SAM-dependent methyltransferase